MPVTTTTSYTCETCAASVDDAALLANTTLRRIVFTGDITKGVGDPVALERAGAGDGLVFCGWAHAVEWANAQTF